MNNASTFFPVPVGEMEPSHWEELIGSNLRAPLFISQQAAPELAKNEGSIVNIVDIHAERPLKGYALYSVAKAGLAALTRSLALELAPRVRVNGVAPGAIAWPEDGQFDDAERERIVATTPLGRLGSPDDIARAVHFLACAPYRHRPDPRGRRRPLDLHLGGCDGLALAHPRRRCSKSSGRSASSTPTASPGSCPPR